jgi:O-antigen/teichoic acid export membrane protein
MWDLILKNKQKILVFIYGGGLLINVVLNLVFIPQFGILAAAVSTGLTEAAVLTLLFRSSLTQWRQNAV